MKKYLFWFLTISWASLTFYLTTIPNFHPSNDTFVSWLLSNSGHFFFFGIQAVLLSLALPYWPLTITSLYGLFIEFIQLGIPGRSFDLFDWALDTLGAIIFLAIIKKYENSYYWRRWIHRGDHR